MERLVNLLQNTFKSTAHIVYVHHSNEPCWRVCQQGDIVANQNYKTYDVRTHTHTHIVHKYSCDRIKNGIRTKWTIGRLSMECDLSSIYYDFRSAMKCYQRALRCFMSAVACNSLQIAWMRDCVDYSKWNTHQKPTNHIIVPFWCHSFYLLKLMYCL